jgi:inorganic pyrophosphatase
MNEDDHKILARLRREQQLKAIQDGYDFRTRFINSKKQYRRNLKYKPQDASEWERVEIWP